MNNKGFTLVEILAVVVILGMVMAIAIPNVSKLIKINEGNNYEQLKSTIMSAAKMYISDHKYEIVVNGSCSNPSDKISISKINTYDVIDDKLVISELVDDGNIKTDKVGNIIYPYDKEKKLDLSNSYVIVKYNCKTRDYIYSFEDDDANLIWVQKN